MDGQENKNRENLTMILSISNSLPVDKKKLRKSWSMSSNHVELAPAPTSFYSNVQHQGKKEKEEEKAVSNRTNECMLLAIKNISSSCGNFLSRTHEYSQSLPCPENQPLVLHHLHLTIDKLPRPRQGKGIIIKQVSSKK